MPSGVRVIRGPDWRWKNQDGGQGCTGSAVMGTRKDGWIDVKWDNGTQAEYRAGAEGKHDLRIFDLAQAGVRHLEETPLGVTRIDCSACAQSGIRGFRWTCVRCPGVNLCTRCYMADKHDTQHAFKRYDSLESDPVVVQARKEAPTWKVSGIFEGAVVIKGPDWKWKDQDGPMGQENQGVVVAIADWTDDGCHAAARVLWAECNLEIYRVGYEGKMDLVCVRPAEFGNVYYDHLPIIGVDPGELETDDVMTQDVDHVMRSLDLSDPRRRESTASSASLDLSQNEADVSNRRLRRRESEVAYAASSPAHACQYFQTCQRVIDMLDIKVYQSPRFDTCFCSTCISKRKDNATFKRGNPATTYAIPKGWSKFGLTLPPRATELNVMEDWHVAFHGTTLESVKKILNHDDLLMPGEVGIEGAAIHEGEGHYNDDNRPTGFNTKQVFLSPSINYAGLPLYARTMKFKDRSKMKTAQFAFQVRIKPGSYKVAVETVRRRNEKDKPWDPHIPNSELEWSTTQKRVIILTGVLVKVKSE